MPEAKLQAVLEWWLEPMLELVALTCVLGLITEPQALRASHWLMQHGMHLLESDFELPNEWVY